MASTGVTPDTRPRAPTTARIGPACPRRPPLPDLGPSAAPRGRSASYASHLAPIAPSSTVAPACLTPRIVMLGRPRHTASGSRDYGLKTVEAHSSGSVTPSIPFRARTILAANATIPPSRSLNRLEVTVRSVCSPRRRGSSGSPRSGSPGRGACDDAPRVGRDRCWPSVDGGCLPARPEQDRGPRLAGRDDGSSVGLIFCLVMSAYLATRATVKF